MQDTPGMCRSPELGESPCYFCRDAAMMIRPKFRIRYIRVFMGILVLLLIRSMLLDYNYELDVGASLRDPVLGPRMNSQDLFLIVLVLSTPESFIQRQAIRETWGSITSTDSKGKSDKKVKLVFVLGGLGHVDSALRREHSEKNDLLIGSFEETYRNLVVKVFVGLKWASTQRCKYVFKADEDVFLNIPRVVEWVEEIGSPQRLYAGEVVNNNTVLRWPWAKYSVSPLVYEPSYYPPYCRGAFYLLSRPVLPAILEEVAKRRAFAVEDAFLGVIANAIGLMPAQIRGCSSSRKTRWSISNWNDSTFNEITCCGDAFDDRILRYIHYRKLYLSEKLRQERGNLNFHEKGN